MKLAHRYNRANMLVSLFILLTTAICYYFLIEHVLTEDMDKDLEVEEQEIYEYARQYKKLLPQGFYSDQNITYTLVRPGTKIQRRFINKSYLGNGRSEPERGRSLISSITLSGKTYLISINKSTVNASYLLRLIFLINLSISALLLASLILTNSLLLKRLWKPFYTILGQMKDFKVSETKRLETQATDIDEFAELNQVALKMSNDAVRDYSELRNFTDNAAHELMTPLAVVNSKLDNLLQTGTFTDPQGDLLNDVYRGMNRLVRLNSSLLLLAKIDNQLIKNEEEVHLHELIQSKVKEFKELLESKEISVNVYAGEEVVFMDKSLAEILINNLIINAIRYNNRGGSVTIRLGSHRLSVSNTGKKTALDSNRIFERFYKNVASEGMGLGLAICRQICLNYKFDLQYNYHNEQHCFSITFKNTH